MTALPLGRLRLQLVATTPTTQRVLLPRKGAMPLLRQAVEWHGFGVEQQPAACQEPAAWIKRARDRRLAMPVCSDLLGSEWLTTHALIPLLEQPTLVEQLWLLLPQEMGNSSAARHCARMIRLLRVQISKATVMQDLHETQ